jgi:hypothetical protein
MHASTGIINVARLGRVPIVPIVFATSRRRVLGSWDRFHLALPFGRGVFLWGEPIEIAAELDPAGLEHARLLVEGRMNEMVREADRRVGHEPPLQDGPSPATRERKGPAPQAWEGERHMRHRPSPSHCFAMGPALSRLAGEGLQP